MYRATLLSNPAIVEHVGPHIAGANRNGAWAFLAAK